VIGVEVGAVCLDNTLEPGLHRLPLVGDGSSKTTP